MADGGGTGPDQDPRGRARPLEEEGGWGARLCQADHLGEEGGGGGGELGYG